MTLPNFLIIGAQKSASTFIHQCLAEHPEVFMPLEEISYFEDPDYQQTDPRQFERLFSNVKTEKAIGIKRPNYLAKPEVPDRIKELLPNAKLIAVLRNPVARAVSAYFHYANNGFIPAGPIEVSMSKLLDGDYTKSRPKAQEILEYGFYCKHLKRYLSLFDREQMLILFHEDVARDNLGGVQKTYRFLEIDESYVPRQLSNRPQAVIYSLARIRLLRLRNSHLFTYNSDKTRLFVKKQGALDKAICRTIDTADRFVLSRVFGNDKPRLSDGLRRRLYSLYEKDIADLEALLRVDLKIWKDV
jgi:hypothetical protein